MRQLERLRERLAGLERQGLRRERKTTDSACVTCPSVDGRVMQAFCSNDYLGLANDPRIAQALQEGVAMYGTGSGASHLISGHYRVHALLEERLASFVAPHIPQAAALYFSTGYMANVGVIGAMAALDSNIEIFSEALNHASLIDGMRLARASVKVYAHCDVQALADMLGASTASTKLVVTDSVFSMDGDLAPLAPMLSLCEQHDAWLLVDDAHGFGALGHQGHGVLEHLGLKSERIIYVGTLGKAAGVAGAFVGANESVIDWLVQRARSYVYSTASPPALAHALLASLDIIESPEGVERRARLQSLITVLSESLSLGRWQRVDSSTAIQPIVIGSNDAAMLASAKLHDLGFWVPAIRPPTVPPGSARLRITLSAGHDKTAVARLGQTISQIEGSQRNTT